MTTYETVRARPISFEEITKLSLRNAEPIEAFRAKVTKQHGLTLTPITVTPEPAGSKLRLGDEVPHQQVFLAIPDDGPNGRSAHTFDRTKPVGYAVDVTTLSLFKGRARLTLFTSAEAEVNSELAGRSKQPAKVRESIYVRDDLAQPVHLTPVYGSRLNVGVVVAGLDPEDVARRAEEALQREFGDALGTLRNVATVNVEDLRVDVFATSDKDEVLAVNVLMGEVGIVAPGKPHVAEADPTTPPPPPAD